MKNKKIYVACTVTILTLILVFNPFRKDKSDNSNLPLQDNVQKELLEVEPSKVDSSQATIKKSPSNPSANKETDTVKVVQFSIESFETLTAEEIQKKLKPPFDCTNYEAINDDEQLKSFVSFTEEQVLFNYEKLKPYSLYSKEELHKFADSGDTLAMYTLGLSYVNNSMVESFIPRYLKYDKNDSTTLQRKPFDEELMDRGLFWLAQASYTEFPSAILAANQARKQKMIFLQHESTNDNPSEKDIAKHNEEMELLQKQNLVSQFVLLEIFPILSELPVGGLRKVVDDQMSKLSVEENKLIMHEASNKLTVWKEMREENGYSDVVEYDISAEDLVMGSYKAAFKGYCDGLKR